MRMITLLGSAKKKGNTATVLGWVEEEMAALGHDVQRIYVHERSINGCMGCAQCKKNPDEIACVQKDEAPEILAHMLESDIVLFASPIYFWGFSAQLKALIDRSYALVTNYHKPGHTSLMQGKRLGLLVTGGSGYEHNAEGMFEAFDRYMGFLLAQQCGCLYVGNCTKPDELSEETRQQARDLARSLAG